MKHYDHVIKNNKTHLVAPGANAALCKTTIKPFSGTSHASKATKCSVCFAERKSISVQAVIDTSEAPPDMLCTPISQGSVPSRAPSDMKALAEQYEAAIEDRKASIDKVE